MTRTFQDRVALERRFLACVFAYQRALDIHPHCFLSPEHAVIFDAIQEMGREWPATPGHEQDGYDDIGVSLVVELCGQRARAGALGHHRFVPDEFRSFVRRYLVEDICSLPTDPDVIDSLADLVRECPRCGR